MVHMRVLLTTKRGAGHFGPLIPFAHAFRRAGAEVLVAAPHSAHAMVRDAGFPTWLFDEAPDEARDAIFARAREMHRDDAGPYVFTEAFARLDARAALPGVLEACRHWRPDVVVSEICEFAGPIVAEAVGLRGVCVGISQQGKGEAVAAASEVIPALDELRADVGLPADPTGAGVVGNPYFTLVPEALEDPATPASRMAWRFRVPDAPGGGSQRWAGDDRPLVYITFGSVVPEMELFPSLYRGAIDAIAPLPVRVLVTVGRDRDPAELGPLPENVTAERWVPQREVMPHAAAMVCHGGSGTVTMGLAGGVPMAILPLFADQPWNAERVAAIGAGIALDEGPGAAARLGDAISKLIIDPAYRTNARLVAADMRALPSVDHAPALVRELVADRVAAPIV
jgi:UDP:flavonoid glycosyltransferase YjiC (YdhE family)